MRDWHWTVSTILAMFDTIDDLLGNYGQNSEAAAVFKKTEVWDPFFRNVQFPVLWIPPINGWDLDPNSSQSPALELCGALGKSSGPL